MNVQRSPKPPFQFAPWRTDRSYSGQHPAILSIPPVVAQLHFEDFPGADRFPPPSMDQRSFGRMAKGFPASLIDRTQGRPYIVLPAAIGIDQLTTPIEQPEEPRYRVSEALIYRLEMGRRGRPPPARRPALPLVSGVSHRERILNMIFA